MFAAIILIESKEKLVIPSKWIYSLDIVQVFNIGISHTKTHKIFYSPNLNDEPDFKASLEREFTIQRKCCYEAKIYRFFGKPYHIT